MKTQFARKDPARKKNSSKTRLLSKKKGWNRFESKPERKIRYAVVGLGSISQMAVLPAFAHVSNSRLTALVSSDPKKLKVLGQRHRVKNLYSYDQYEECLRSGEIDAIYIALPNEQHREYAERAAAAGIHVLCEKPMAITPDDCESMIRATDSARVKLMIAYRLHFEAANLRAIELVRSGKLGEPRIFSSTFSIPVTARGIRLAPHSQGGGPTYDIGIYCINAARYIFDSEPIEVLAISAARDQERFRHIEETMSVVLRFPDEKIAAFTCTFGGASSGSFQVVGNQGTLVVSNAYEYAATKRIEVTLTGKKTRTEEFSERDQFAPELEYFSNCVLFNRTPEPSGWEGWSDIRIIQAIFEAERTKMPVKLAWAPRHDGPNHVQEIRKPPIQEPKWVDTEGPGGEEAA